MLQAMPCSHDAEPDPVRADWCAECERLEREAMKFSNHKNEIERQIIVLLVEDLLEAGYEISVNDGEETTLTCSTDEVAIFAAMSSTDEDRLLLSTGGRVEGWVAWIRLIYGNGADVISDNTTNIPEAVFERANELAERFG